MIDCHRFSFFSGSKQSILVISKYVGIYKQKKFLHKLYFKAMTDIHTRAKVISVDRENVEVSS